MAKERTVEAVIFDLYGTLIGEPPFDDVCFPLLAEAIGISRAELARVRGLSVADAMTGRLATAEDRARVMLRELGRSEDDDLVCRLATIERDARWPAVRPYPATIPTLSALREQGIPIGLVSDCTGLMGRPLVERLELTPYFDAIALSHEVGHAKPAREIYQAALDRLGLDPRDCLYVGDGASDELNGAKALGMTTVRIDQEHGFGRIGRPAPTDYLIVRLDELLGLPPLAPEALPLPRLDVSWVRSDLAVGGKVDPLNFARLRIMGIESVVDLRAEDSDDPELLAAAGIRFLHLPMPDCEPLTQRQMGDGSAWVASERRAGRKVLLHCQHGIGRSVMLATAVLMHDGIGPTVALDQIRDRRPNAAPNPLQLAAIYEYAAAQARRRHA